MPRNSLKPGQAGDPSEPKWNEHRKVFQINCLVGEPIGKPTRVHASGKTKRAAKDNLKERVAEWKPRSILSGPLSKTPTVAEAALAMLELYEKNPKKRPQNLRSFRREVEPATARNAKKDKITIVGSDLGNMNPSDVIPMHIRLHLQQMNDMPSKQSAQKTVLKKTFQMLVDDGLLTFNPVASVKGYSGELSTTKTRKGKKVNPYFPNEPQPFSVEEMELYWRMEAEYFRSASDRYPRDPKYRDFTKLAYELAARPGEVPALIWPGIDLDAATVQIAGTIIDNELRVRQLRAVIENYELKEDDFVAPPGWQDRDERAVVSVVFRQPFTKTADSMRTIKVSGDTVAMLRRRRMAAAPGQRLVIPSRFGKVLSAENASGTWRSIVKGTPLDWSTMRVLRSTRAQRVAEAHGLPAAREILGHEENSAVTTDHYVVVLKPVVDFPDAR